MSRLIEARIGQDQTESVRVSTLGIQAVDHVHIRAYLKSVIPSESASWRRSRGIFQLSECGRSLHSPAPDGAGSVGMTKGLSKQALRQELKAGELNIPEDLVINLNNLHVSPAKKASPVVDLSVDVLEIKPQDLVFSLVNGLKSELHKRLSFSERRHQPEPKRVRKEKIPLRTKDRLAIGVFCFTLLGILACVCPESAPDGIVESTPFASQPSALRIISEATSKESGCDQVLIYAIWESESGVVDCSPYRDVPGKNSCRSSAGAEGPLQFMPETWLQYAESGWDKWDLYDAARTACRTVKDLRLQEQRTQTDFATRFSGKDGGQCWNCGDVGYEQAKNIWNEWQQLAESQLSPTSTPMSQPTVEVVQPPSPPSEGETPPLQEFQTSPEQPSSPTIKPGCVPQKNQNGENNAIYVIEGGIVKTVHSWANGYDWCYNPQAPSIEVNGKIFYSVIFKDGNHARVYYTDAAP